MSRATSLAKARLSYLYDELMLVLGDDGRKVGQFTSLHVVDQPEPMLLVGEHGVVTIDEDRGWFVFQEHRSSAELVVITSTEERLLDHVFDYLWKLERVPVERYVRTAVQMLVGQQLAHVEQLLIVETIRQHRGNRTMAAQTLGISLQTMRSKLRAIAQPAPCGSQ